MNYVAEFSPEAIDDLAAAELTDELLDEFDIQVGRLESSPSALSRPSWFPYPQCQVFEFTVKSALQRTRFRLLFKYGTDERSLYVLRVDVARLTDFT